MKRFVSFISILAFTGLIFAQNHFFENYVYQSWSAFGGLSGTTATDILQTSDGYINIGTYEGLVKFDGVEFLTFNQSKKPEYNFVSVRSLLQDSRGNIWVGSNDEGLHCISSAGSKSYTTENGLPNNSVRALYEDKNGNVWVGTASGIVYITYDGKMISPQFEAGSIAKGSIVSHIFCDAAGTIWASMTNENGFFRLVDGVFRRLPELDLFEPYFVTAIFQDNRGTFWLGLGDEGIVTMDKGKITRVKTDTILDNIPTQAIYQEPNGTIWFGTEKGLVVYSNGSFTHYTGSQDLEASNINKIIRDREGNIWFATDRNGIGKMTHGKFKVQKLGVTVNSLSEAPDEKVWAGTDEGVLCYENDELVTNDLTEYTKGLRIRHVEALPNGKILVCCYTKPAFIIYDGKTIQKWSTDEGLVGNKVRVAIETSKDEYYIGTTTGLTIMHKDGTLKNLKQLDGLDTEYVMAICKGADGHIWIGTDGGGIFIMKNEEFVGRITSDDGLSGNVIFKITQDTDGNYWVCTGSGITRCSNIDKTSGMPRTFATLNAENGIGTNSVFQIIMDKNQNLWITNNHGIASAAMKDVNRVLDGSVPEVNTKYYNRNDGLDSDGPTSTARSIMDRHGRLWFTMVDGIAIYDSQKIQENTVMPLVIIEQVTIDNVPYKSHGNYITLAPGTKRVDIKYTGISFDAPERILFTHKLTDFESEFSPIASERTVSYTNLTPGRHTFLVNAINGNGVSSENAEMMFFYQKPYFYQHPVFWICFTFIIVSTIMGFFFVHERRIKRENIRLEKMVQMKTADLEIEKDKSDHLLRSILPDKIANKLKDTGIRSFGEEFECATLLFSDIVGFTKISSSHSADEIVKALNDLFTRFDERAKQMGVEKIKTIGDAYMAACGIPDENPEHARVMIDFAKGMYEDLAEYNKTGKIPFQIRIGLNCGPVTAGVIGTTKFIYDVWGNTVNVASRMESVCSPGKIRLSADLRDHLYGSDIAFGSPIECEIKGKGLMKTYEIDIND